jgi:hypothetical protein
METAPMSAKQAAESGQQVYRGQEFAGSILKTSGAWNAYSVAGRKLGRFATALEAQRAVLSGAAAKR